MKERQTNRKGCLKKALLFFGFAIIGLLCFILCKLYVINDNIEEGKICCPPFVADDTVCNESFKTKKLIEKNNVWDGLTVEKHQPYYCNQVIVLFKPGYNKTASEGYLRDSLRLEKIKDCPNCDKIDIELWGRDGNIPIQPEDKTKIAKNKVPPESDGHGIITAFNYLIERPIGSIVPTISPNPNQERDTIFNFKPQGSGKKVIVALIDSGIDFSHNNFLRQFEWRNGTEFYLSLIHISEPTRPY